MNKVFGFLCILSILACEKEEPLLDGRFITDQVGQANMTSDDKGDYRMQLYYDLGTAELKAKNSRDSWDLAFSGDVALPNIFTNSAMLMRVALTGHSDFDFSYKPGDFDFEYERSNCFYTRSWMSKAIANNSFPSEVILIDLGRDLQNNKRGYKKLQILSVDQGFYHLLIADTDGKNLAEIKIQTDPQYNYQFISFDQPEHILTLEPPKDEWDLYFTKYMERLWDGSDTVDYSVTGVLLNPWNTKAYMDTVLSNDPSISFSGLRLEDVKENLLSSQQNVIGHDWKYFDLDAETYIIKKHRFYFIRDVENVYYRFRFTGFHDQSGNRGAVTFEFLPL